MKPTQGPWGFESFALSEEIIAMGGKLVAVVQSRHCESPEEMRANAALIAAAPDMLDALEYWMDVGDDHKAIDKAREAIAKARGTQ